MPKKEKKKKEDRFDKIENSIDTLSKEVKGGFKDVNKKLYNSITASDKRSKELDKKITDLTDSMTSGFENMQRYIDIRFNGIDKELAWTKETLENHTGLLKKLDQERFFTIEHVKRLESDIAKVKTYLDLK